MDRLHLGTRRRINPRNVGKNLVELYLRVFQYFPENSTISTTNDTNVLRVCMAHHDRMRDHFLISAKVVNMTMRRGKGRDKGAGIRKFVALCQLYDAVKNKDISKRLAPGCMYKCAKS